MITLSLTQRTKFKVKTRFVSTAWSLLAILSLLLTSLPLPLMLPVPTAHAAESTQSGSLYRADVTLTHPYDATRLAQLGLHLYNQTDSQATVFATKAQLATLARRGFQPTNIVPQTTLSQLSAAGVTAAELSTLDAPDSDGDGLTDQEEEWWCTDPNDPNSDSSQPPSQTNPSDGDEVAAILNGVTAYGPPFRLWPNFTPYNANGTCPDGDFDGVPDEAEELIIGTSPLRESSDKDKFDDGQELFGVTFCPASSGPCGYGILPRAEDAAFVSANLPAWVLPPGDSPWVAAFPEPEVEVVPSSIKMTARTTIQTEKTITEGEERTYGSASTTGTSSSKSETVTWNTWEEVAISTPQLSQAGIGIGDEAISTQGFGVGLAVGFAASYFVGKGIDCIWEEIVDGTSICRRTGEKIWDAIAPPPFSADDQVDIPEGLSLEAYNMDPVQTVQGKNDCGLSAGFGIPSTELTCQAKGVNVKSRNDKWSRLQGSNINAQNLARGHSSNSYELQNNSTLLSQPFYELSFPAYNPVPVTTVSKGSERGGALTTQHTQYEEQTISESSTNQFSESWANATAVDTAHAADLRFTYNIVNNGTEYAREVTSLLFNIYIGNDPNPAYTYVAVGSTGQIAKVENLFPGESLDFTSEPIALTLDEMQAIDEGAPIRIVMEDIAYGQDQVFYQDAFNGSVRVAMEDGFDDGDETIDTYLIPVWDPSDTVQDVLKRYFPATEDRDGDLLSISTPEFTTNPPVFNEHALTGTSWWNMYLSEGLNYNGDFKSMLAKPNTSVVIRINSDRDLDGYNDRNETKLGTDPDDPTSHPNPELLAGTTTECDGNDCTVLMSFLNTGNYDAYGVEAIMYSPDGLADITNNTIGGSGRVPAGQQVVLGTRILAPELGNWSGGAQPYSSGFYLGDVDRTLTFTAPSSGNIGAGSLTLNWSDDQGGSGTIQVGSGYQAPLPLPITQGIAVGFQTGSVNAGETFTVQALTPRDTFQYTRNDPAAEPPVIVVSYNDPQGNHRFILPTGAYPDGAQLTDLQQDLQALSGQMLPDVGVDIASTSESQAHFVLNSPHPTPITDAHLFVEYIDGDGNVDHEDVFTQTLEAGPTIIPVTVDTNSYDPAETILLAFMTDSQGNIIDSSARPLASFGPDPLPVANLTAGDWQVGTLSIQSVPDPWDFGVVEAGTLLSAELTLGNTGLAPLQYTLAGLENGLTLAGSSAGSLAPTDTRRFELTLDTANMAAGPFNRPLTLRTNDPKNASITINLHGVIEGTTGGAVATQVNPYRPWDQYVAIVGPRNVNDTVVFSHTISDTAAQMHPLYLYNEDESELKGVGEFGIDFSGRTSSFEMFGTGVIGDLVVGPTGNCGSSTCYTDNTRTPLASTVSAGQVSINLSSTSGFATNDEVLIIQMQGTGVGNYEFGTISNINGNTLTLYNSLDKTFTVGGSSKVQVIKVPHYQNVTIQSGGNLTVHNWNGSTGGVLAFRASGEVIVDSMISASSRGYRGGMGGQSGPTGKQGESYNGAGGTSTNRNNGGGGGGQGSYDADGADGGGGGGYGGGGVNGQSGGGGGSHIPGQGGDSYGSSSLDTDIRLGSGGGGGGGYMENSLHFDGGNGGGIVLFFARNLTIVGTVEAKGADGATNPYYASSGPAGARRTGAGGGGAGGSVYLVTNNNVTGSIYVSGGNGGTADEGGNGGGGGSGRIRFDSCETTLDCYIMSQLPGLPDNDTKLYLPDAMASNNTLRYVAQYGQRSSDTSGGDQLFSVRLPNRGYTGLALSALVERAAGSESDFNICFDIGNDGTCDWTPAPQSFGGPVRLDSDAAVEPALAAALDTYIQTQAGSADSLLIPIRVNIDTPADLFLFNLTATPGDDVDLTPLTLTLTPADGSDLDNIPAGTPVTMGAVISNSGTYTAENFTVAFYNGSPGAQDSTVVGAQFIEALGPLLTTTVTETWQTAGLSGTNTIVVKADTAERVAEIDETNNTRAISATIYQDLTGLDWVTIDAGDATDVAYQSGAGYGWLTPGEIVTACGAAPEQSYRQASSINTLDYRFDNLAPGKRYHLDLTFALCSGERWLNIFVDGEQAGESKLGLAGSTVIPSTHITTALQTVSILLDPAAYADGAIDLSLVRAKGLGGPLVNLIDLREIDYCYRDSGPGEPVWTSANGCGYTPGPATDVYNGWGQAPAQTVRFNESGPVEYKFTELDPAKEYQVGLTLYEGDGLSRQQELRFDGLSNQVVTLGSQSQKIVTAVPPAAYSDGQVTLAIEEISGGSSLVSEVALEEVTRRYPGRTSVFPAPTPPPPGSPQVEFASFLAYWDGSHINVEWSTTTEINNASFTLYRSTDTQTWLKIHQTPSSQPCGTYSSATPVSYAFTDTSVTDGTTYYYQIQYSGEGCGGSTTAVSSLMAQAIGDLEGQSIPLGSGWRLVSFRVEPPVKAPPTVLSYINSRYDRVLGEAGIYSTELAAPFNTLDAMRAGQGYYLRVTQPTGAGLLVEGTSVPHDKPIALHQGWNWLGYLPKVNLPLKTALQSIDGDYQRVLSLNQSHEETLPEFSTLKVMEPGQGYLIYVTNPTTLVYPAGTGSTALSGSSDDACSHVSPTPKKTLVYGQISVGEQPSPIGTQVEAVTERGTVAGCFVIEKEGQFGLMQIYGEDDTATPAIDGFREGEAITFRVNGSSAEAGPAVKWQDDWAPHQTSLVGGLPKMYLPIVVK